MKRIAIITIVFLSVISLSRAQEKMFEGVVVYTLEFEPIDTTINVEELSFIRSYEVMFFKNGEYRKEIYAANDVLVETSILSLDSLAIFTNYPFIDSLGMSSVQEPLEVMQLKDSSYSVSALEILGHNCSSLTTKLINQESGERIEFTYHFSTDFPIDPEWYKDFGSGFYNQVNSEVTGINLGLDILYSNTVKEKYRAVRIIEMELPESLLDIEQIKTESIEILEPPSDQNLES